MQEFIPALNQEVVFKCACGALLKVAEATLTDKTRTYEFYPCVNENCNAFQRIWNDYRVNGIYTKTEMMELLTNETYRISFE